ncbi:aspartate kinase, partial [Burkholderia pseudomallei]|nr:aspartate kinase [Burkholderia pseudomallei]
MRGLIGLPGKIRHARVLRPSRPSRRPSTATSRVTERQRGLSSAPVRSLFQFRTTMALIVHKYGGTSMGSVERIKNVAKRVAKWHQ